MQNKRGSNKGKLFYKTLIVVFIVLIFNILVISFKFGNFNEGITGFSVKSTVSNSFDSMPFSAKTLFVLQWVFLLGALIFTYAKDQKLQQVQVQPANLKNRVPTGIPGFDALVQGGFPKSSSVLVAGGPGTGKSIFCLEYLIKGATKFKEKGLYITFEQRAEELRNQAKQFGWNLEDLEKKGWIKIISVPVEKITPKTITEIQTFVKRHQIKRLVIDSLSTLVINAPIHAPSSGLSVQDVVGDNIIFSPPIIGDFFVQKFLYAFIEKLRDLDCTTLLIAESDQSGKNITRDTLSEFACDGVVLITFESLGGDYSRSLTVRKMRGTKNNEDVHPVEISKSGIVVHKIE